jgi:3-phenylpropionate/trans-cinnamate dioxygenase ferredoxin reductase subunit
MSEPVLPNGILIIGAGQAGGCAAAALRANGYAGRIVLAGAEMHRPYERPPLSKALLLDADADDSVFLHPPAFHAGLELDWRPGVQVAALDPASRLAHTDAGDAIRFDRALLATGGRARLLPSLPPQAPHVHYLRGLDDARRLRDRLRPDARVIVIGGGFLGLEFAWSARSKGMAVTVCEAGERLLGRAAPPQISAWLQARHEDAGIRILAGARLQAIDAGGSSVCVTLAQGEALRADFLLVAIGQEPNLELARSCGIDIDDGIAVDARCETSAAGIFAAGDCASHFNAFLQRRVRLESWQNAQEQARIAASAMLGIEANYQVLPWFWSDQCGMNLQMLGLPGAGLRYVVRGQLHDARFQYYGFDGDRLRYVFAVNGGGDMRPLRMLMEAGAPVDAALLADSSQPVRAMVKQALA